jgi:hypothetical protein
VKDDDGCSESFPAPRCLAKDEEVNIAQLMARIRHHVLVNRLRVSASQFVLRTSDVTVNKLVQQSLK